jgi:polyisoprenoid-binding protein YceI
MTDTKTANSAFAGIDLPAAGTYQIETSHSTIGAVARHLVVTKVRGRFTDFSGEIVVDEDPTKSSVNVVIDAASIDTHSTDRDVHLRSADFLDVEKFPELSFTSTDLKHVKGKRFDLSGVLTIKDVTRPITLEAEFLGNLRDPWGRDVIAFEAEGDLDREEWGITWNVALETGGVLVSKKLTFELQIEAVKQTPEQPAG